MRTIINAFAAAAILVAAPAFAETKPGAPAPTASSASSDEAVKDKRYCASNANTGSRIPRKVCKTRAQWIEDDGFDPLAQK